MAEVVYKSVPDLDVLGGSLDGSETLPVVKAGKTYRRSWSGFFGSGWIANLLQAFAAFKSPDSVHADDADTVEGQGAATLHNAALLTGNIHLDRIPAELTGKNAATATKLATARTIGGVSFDGTANINLPGVNTAGNQNTSGNAATATTAAACSGNAATATYATSAGSASSASTAGYADSAGTAAACSGNAATATVAASCSGNSATASNASAVGGYSASALLAAAATAVPVIVVKDVDSSQSHALQLPQIPGAAGDCALYIISTRDTDGDSSVTTVIAPSSHGFGSLYGFYQPAANSAARASTTIATAFAGQTLFTFNGNSTAIGLHFLFAARS